MDFEKSIELIESKIGYTFRDKKLLRQAFTRSSWCNEHKSKGSKPYISNEVLEFFGDSILSSAIIGLFLEEKTSRYEHGIYTELKEGDFTVIRSKLSDKSNLSKSMTELGLGKYLIMSAGDEKEGIGKQPSVLEDLFEAIVGAVYIDSGKNMSVATELVRRTIDLSSYLSTASQNAKNLLQEWCANKKHRLPLPKYVTVSESGPDNEKVYERGCYIGDELISVGRGKNHKLAELAAAESALAILKRRSEGSPSMSPSAESISTLKSYAVKKKLATPEFRDLGESSFSNEHLREYVIECRFMGKSATATARSKQEARAMAAEMLLEEIRREEAPAKHPERKKNGTADAKQSRSASKSQATKESKPVAKPQKAPKKAPHYHKKRS